MAELRFRIGLYHGYELIGSGSNEYTRYLSRSLAEKGHEVHIICREEKGHTLDFVREVIQWSADGTKTVVAGSETGTCVLH
jgi:hypothetical protein